MKKLSHTLLSKKAVSIILAIVLVCTMLFSLVACESTDADIESLNAKIAELTDQIAEAENEIDKLEVEKAAQSAEITSLEADLETLRTEKTALEEEIADLKTEIARLRALMDANSDALLEEIDKLEAQIDSLEARKSELETSSLEKDEEIKALRNCLKDIHSFKDGICIICGKESEKAYTREGDYIYFGEYPQTLKADSVTITSTTDERGYYLGDDGCYYAKVSADPHYNDFTFSTGASITKGTVYYFKVEPIRWRILSEENGEAFLLCDSIIDVLSYQWDFYDRYQTYYNNADGVPEGTYANNYKYSEIRAWLNTTFYETAFSALQQEIILITEVDNSAKSTNPHGNETAHNGGVNEYVCENTNDKIFLLSQEEATNEAYGFSSSESADESREMITSDYSRALGALMITTEDYYGNGWWYHRSPDCNRSGYAYRSSTDGHCNSSIWVDYTNLGTVPALRIQL